MSNVDENMRLMERLASVGILEEEGNALEVLKRWVDEGLEEGRSRLEWGNPPPEVVQAGRLVGQEIDKYKVFEVREDGTLEMVYVAHELGSAKTLALMHRDMTDAEVVIKTSPEDEKARLRLKAIKDRGKYRVMPPLSSEEHAHLKDGIRENGISLPIVEDQQGHIIDGHHRLLAWRELMNEGVDLGPIPRLSSKLKGVHEKRNEAFRLNMIRRHLSQEQKREVVKAKLKESPEWGDNRVGQLLGVSDAAAPRWIGWS
jgi:hypothetical protein